MYSIFQEQLIAHPCKTAIITIYLYSTYCSLAQEGWVIRNSNNLFFILPSISFLQSVEFHCQESDSMIIQPPAPIVSSQIIPSWSFCTYSFNLNKILAHLSAHKCPLHPLYHPCWPAYYRILSPWVFTTSQPSCCSPHISQPHGGLLNLTREVLIDGNINWSVIELTTVSTKTFTR